MFYCSKQIKFDKKSKMFKSALPERKPVCFSKSQILEDIEAVCQDEEQRNKLFFCIDEKPPQENRFSQMEEFLKGTNNLEDVYENLKDLIKDVDKLTKEIGGSANELKIRVADVKLQD